MNYNGYSRPVVYRGIRMWSEKERDFARWFEAYGHDDWIYEPKAMYEEYVPDFWLPKLRLRLFFEIKPSEYAADCHKWEPFCVRQQVGILLFCGSPHYKSSCLFLPSQLMPQDVIAKSQRGEAIPIEEPTFKTGAFTYYKLDPDCHSLLKAQNHDQAVTAMERMLTSTNEWTRTWGFGTPT